MVRIALLALALALPSATTAEEAVRVVRGTSGLVPVPFAARNEANRPIGCVAALAHWYSLDLGLAEPGHSVEATLWSDARTGEVFLLNPSQDRMPVQAMACGLAGSAWSSGTRVAIGSKVGAPPAAVTLACRQDGTDLIACRSLPVMTTRPPESAGSQ